MPKCRLQTTNPEDGITEFNRGGSVQSRSIPVHVAVLPHFTANAISLPFVSRFSPVMPYFYFIPRILPHLAEFLFPFLFLVKQVCLVIFYLVTYMRFNTVRFYRCPRHRNCYRISPADAGFLCDEAAVLGAVIKGGPCVFLQAAFSTVYSACKLLSARFHLRTSQQCMLRHLPLHNPYVFL